MPQVTNRPGEIQEAQQKSKIFCETVFKQIITTSVAYGEHLTQDTDEAACVEISGISVKPPKSALKIASQKLCNLAAKFSMPRANQCTSVDLANCLKNCCTTTAEANVLITGAFDIFQSYEKHLMNTDVEDLPAYGKMAAEKILKYYVYQTNNVVFNERMITAAVFSDEYSKKSILQCCYGGLFDAMFNFKPDVSINKLDKYFTKAGIWHNGILYQGQSSNPRKYHFRRLFDAEMGNIECLRQFDVNNEVPVTYNYALSAFVKERCFEEVRKHFDTIRMQDIDFKTEVEAKITNLKEEMSRLRKNYRLKLLEELVDSMDVIEHRFQVAASPATTSNNHRDNRDENPGNRRVETNITATKIGQYNQNINQ